MWPTRCCLAGASRSAWRRGPTSYPSAVVSNATFHPPDLLLDVLPCIRDGLELAPLDRGTGCELRLRLLHIKGLVRHLHFYGAAVDAVPRGLDRIVVLALLLSLWLALLWQAEVLVVIFIG